MDKKRKDSKGRVLAPGEGQRKDGRYYYRYQDQSGNRQTVYATTLQELRKKEKDIEYSLIFLRKGATGNTTVLELLGQYLMAKKNLRENTVQGYTQAAKRMSGETLARMRIREVTRMDCQTFFSNLAGKGYSYGTILQMYNLLKAAFQEACEDDVLLKNPCAFKLTNYITKHQHKGVALTQAEQDSLLEFVREDPVYNKYYDIVVVLLGTGLRIGEFCGLTLKDIDFESNYISVNHQLQYNRDFYIEYPKSDCGVRKIPMLPSVRESLLRLCNARRNMKLDNEMIVDGYTNFLVVTEGGKPRVPRDYSRIFSGMLRKYNKSGRRMIEHLTSHTLRHTFATNCSNAGMSVKSTQYLMGHSDASMTLNVYTKSVWENVVKDTKLLGGEELCAPLKVVNG